MRTPGRSIANRVALFAASVVACLLLPGHAATNAPVTSPLGSGATVSLEPAPPQADPRRQRAVFVCQEAGVPVFADRPCDAAATPRTIKVETARPGVAATTAPPAPNAGTRPRPVPQGDVTAPARVAETRCDVLQRQLDDINDRMRTGYSAREAARLWHRWREAKERIRHERC
jgi:hypothetical protein